MTRDLNAEPEEECVHVLDGHQEAVTCVIQLRDGRILSGSEDTTIRLWAIEGDYKFQPRMVGLHKVNNTKSIEGHTRALWQMLELSDGNVATASWDGTLRIWQVDQSRDWMELCVLEGRTVCELQAAPYGIAATSYSADNKIWRYDMNTTEENPIPLRTKCLNGHDEPPWRLVQCQDGRLVSASGEKDLALWNFATSEIVGWFKGHEQGPVADVIELPNQMLVSCAWDRKIIIWSKPPL